MGKLNHERTKKMWAGGAEKRAAAKAMTIKGALPKKPSKPTAWDPVDTTKGRGGAARSLTKEEIAALYPGVPVSVKA